MKRKVFVCTGSDCRKQKRKHAALIDALGDIAKVEKVDCQDICKGPVVGVLVDGRIRWFKRIDSKKARAQLVTFLTDGEMSKALQKLRVK